MKPATSQREQVIALARNASSAILQVYRQDFAVTTKADHSPLTAADLAANRILVEGLAALAPSYPVLSEESLQVPWSERRKWTRYWLVDPLDGTREFIKRNGEFTVNIALIENGEPIFSVIHAPVSNDLFFAQRGHGAWRQIEYQTDIPLSTCIPAPPCLRVAASRSHFDSRTMALKARLGESEWTGVGSSLKFCRIAGGQADLYPRFGPTSEWDTAAGQCILEAAGGAVISVQDGAPLRYNRSESLINPDFLALGDPRLPWRQWLPDHTTNTHER